MAKVIKKETKKKVFEKKKINKIVDNNKVSICPTLGIILALTIAALFYYRDTYNILINTIEDKETLKVTLEAIQIVSFNFIKFNIIMLFLELVLYWKKKYNALYVVVGGLIIFNVLSIDLNFLCVSSIPVIIGAYYIIKYKKNPNYF